MLSVYAFTATFPKHETHGLALQMRRAAVSTLAKRTRACISAAIALGGAKGLSNMLPAGTASSAAMAYLPQMSSMTEGLATWVLLVLAALLALGLLTRAVALLLIVLIATGMLSWVAISPGSRS